MVIVAPHYRCVLARAGFSETQDGREQVFVVRNMDKGRSALVDERSALSESCPHGSLTIARSRSVIYFDAKPNPAL